MPSQKLGFAITAGVVAMGALVGGAILFTSSRASEVSLTSAGLVPEDAGVYVALNTDLTSSQWVATFNLVERLGQDDPEDEIKDTLDDEGFDWEDEIAPFLGGNAALFVQGISINDISAEGAVIIRCNDAEAALEVIDDEIGLGDEEEYEGIEYFDADGAFIARINDHLVIAFDERSMKSVIDVHNGETPSLSSNGDFQQLRDELTRNFLAFVYLSTEDMLGDFILDDPVVKAAINDAGAGDLVFKPAAWVIGAKADGFEFQAASLGEGGVVSPLMAPRESKLAKYIPADAAFFFSTVDIARTWNEVMAKARPQIDEAIREEGEYDSLDDALRAAGEELGIHSLEEVVKLLDGETVVAAWFPDGTEENAQGVLMAEVEEAKASALMKQIAASGRSGSVRTEQANGHELITFESDEGEDAAYAFLDGNLLLGTPAGVRGVLQNEEPALPELRRYRQTVEQMPTTLGTYAYFDLAALLRLTEGSIPADLDEAEKALSGLIINGVDERGVVRLSGVLTIED